MEALPTVLLKPGEADRIVAGHPWIYHSEILRVTAPVTDGGLVQVKDHRQRLLGVGFFNSKSKIHVRVLSPERFAEWAEPYRAIGITEFVVYWPTGGDEDALAALGALTN